MKTYMFIGCKDLIDYYLTDELLNNNVIVVDYVEKKEYLYNAGFKGNKKRKIKSDKYSSYSLKLDSDKFRNLLLSAKPDCIVIGMTNYYKSYDLFKVMDYLNELFVYHKYNLIYLSSLDNNKRRKLFDESFELVLSNSNITNKILRIGSLVGYNTFLGDLEKRISQIINRTSELFKYNDFYLLDVRDLMNIIVMVDKYMSSNKDDSSILYYYNKDNIDLKTIDSLIINYFQLRDFYQNDMEEYYKNNCFSNSVKSNNHLKYGNYIGIKESIINTCEWYKKTHAIVKKLKSSIKSIIDSSNKEELNELFVKYHQNYLVNKEVVDYIKEKKDSK